MAWHSHLGWSGLVVTRRGSIVMLSRIEPVLLVLADTVLGSSVWVGHYSLVSTGDRSPGISHNLAI